MHPKFTIDDSGLVLPRRIGYGPILIALTAALTHASGAREQAPPTLRDHLDLLVVEGEAIKIRLEASGVDEEEITTAEGGEEAAAAAAEEASPRASLGAIPEALQPLFDPAKPLTLLGVNHTIDAWVTALQSGLEGASLYPDARGVAARRLLGAWFADGRAFLKFAHRLQWAAVQLRFGRPGSADLKALELLGLKDRLETIQALNAWFGALLGITAETPPPVEAEEDNDPASDALNLLVRLVAFANLAWPEDAAARKRLVGAYMQEVSLVSQRASASARARQERAGAEADGDGEGDGADTPEQPA